MTKEYIFIDVGPIVKCYIRCPKCNDTKSLSSYVTGAGIGFRLGNFNRHFVKLHSDSITSAPTKRKFGRDLLSDENAKKSKENVENIPAISTIASTSTSTVNLDDLLSTNRNLTVENEKLKRSMIGLRKNEEINDKLVEEINELKKNNSQLALDVSLIPDYEKRYNDLLEVNAQLKSENIKYCQFKKLNAHFEQRCNDFLSEKLQLNTQISQLKTELHGLAVYKELYDEMIQAQKKLFDEKTKLQDEAGKIKNDYELLVKTHKNTRMQLSMQQCMTDNDSVDCEGSVISELRQKAEHLAINLDKTQSDLFASQIERRNLLHKLLDLQGKVRVMARLRPSLEPISFSTNMEQNQLTSEHLFSSIFGMLQIMYLLF